MAHPEANTYVELAACVFQGANPRLQRLMVRITAISQYVFIFFMCALFALTLGRSLGQIFYAVHLCLPTWTLLACLGLYPVHLFSRRLGSWQNVIFLNCLTIVGLTLIPFYVLWTGGSAAHRIPGSEMVAASELTVKGTLSGLSTMAFAFCSQFLVVEIISEMKDPAEFPLAYVGVSAPFQAFAFLLTGVGGYYFRGNLISGTIVDNVPFGTGLVLSSFCVYAHMIVTYLVKGVVLCRFVHSVCDNEHYDGDSPRAWKGWYAVVTFILASAIFVSQLVPFFGDFVQLIGSSLCPVSCFLLPVVFYVYLKLYGGGKQESQEPIGPFEWTLLGLEVLLSVVLLVAGPYYTMNDILRHWDEAGYPFACHCQDLWDTCGCSAQHNGLESQCSLAGSDSLLLMNATLLGKGSDFLATSGVGFLEQASLWLAA